MITPEIIALTGMVLSSIIFYLYAREVNKEKLTLDGFMLSDRNLKKNQFGSTFAASSFSLAINTMFLFMNAQHYAVFMLVAPVTYLLGHYIFIALVRKSDVDVNDCRTVSDLCYKFFPSKALARLITLMTITSYLMLIFVELFIGSLVLTFFLPQDLIYQTGSFLSIGIIVLLYVRLGGYKALVKTDKWQLFLMMLATSLITIFAVISPVLNDFGAREIFLDMITPADTLTETIIFSVWLTIMNFLVPCTQIANWQRVSACRDTNISWRGLIYGTKHVVLLFLLTLFGFILLKAKGYQLTSLIDFLSLVKNSSWIGAYCIFPLMIVGFCSMVFSSADVAIISVSYALADQNSFQKKFAMMREQQLRKTLTNLIIGILIVLTVIYWFQFTALKDWLLALIYVVCGQIAILSPFCIYILFKMGKNKNFSLIPYSHGNNILIISASLLAWFILLYGAYLTKITEYQLYSQLSAPLGAGIIFLSIIMAGRCTKVYKKSIA